MRNLIIVVLLGAVLCLSNPEEAAHMKALNARATKESGEVLGAIRSIAQAVNPEVAYHNYFFFSVMKRRDKVLSIGAMKCVLPMRD
ncbi:MAG TPA: hypothetical protein PLU30_15200 [Verrucomicrobiae bacterium]|nr:hypothetical protein [Verrucomicrobiae bacterium]